MRKRMKSIVIFLIIISITSGCSLKGNKIEDEIDFHKDTSEENHNEDMSVNVSGKDYDLLYRSEEISNAVVSLFGIDNATSIIFNDIALVALEMADGHEFTDNIKEIVTNTVKEKDNGIDKVFISDDDRVFDKIEEVIISLLHGKSYDSQISNINNILKTIKDE